MLEDKQLDWDKPIAKVQNADGSVSTVRTISTNIDDQEVLIPTVSREGKIMSNDEAVQQYMNSGENFGKYDTVDQANQAAEQLHQRQAKNIQPTNNIQQLNTHMFEQAELADDSAFQSLGAQPEEAIPTGVKTQTIKSPQGEEYHIVEGNSVPETAAAPQRRKEKSLLDPYATDMDDELKTQSDPSSTGLSDVVKKYHPLAVMAKYGPISLAIKKAYQIGQEKEDATVAASDAFLEQHVSMHSPIDPETGEQVPVGPESTFENKVRLTQLVGPVQAKILNGLPGEKPLDEVTSPLEFVGTGGVVAAKLGGRAGLAVFGAGAIPEFLATISAEEIMENHPVVGLLMSVAAGVGSGVAASRVLKGTKFLNKAHLADAASAFNKSVKDTELKLVDAQTRTFNSIYGYAEPVPRSARAVISGAEQGPQMPTAYDGPTSADIDVPPPGSSVPPPPPPATKIPISGAAQRPTEVLTKAPQVQQVMQELGPKAWEDAKGAGSKLTKSQFYYTKTAGFKNQFGASKALDDNGDPEVFYHGSKTAFDEFKPGAATGDKYANHGIYFTNDANLASAYGSEGMVYPSFLKMENPLDITTRFDEGTLKAKIAKLLSPERVRALTEKNKLKDSIVEQFISEKDVQAIKAAGYDSVMANNVRIVFSDDQVISAISHKPNGARIMPDTVEPGTPNIVKNQARLALDRRIQNAMEAVGRTVPKAPEVPDDIRTSLEITESNAVEAFTAAVVNPPVVPAPLVKASQITSTPALPVSSTIRSVDAMRKARTTWFGPSMVTDNPNDDHFAFVKQHIDAHNTKVDGPTQEGKAGKPQKGIYGGDRQRQYAIKVIRSHASAAKRMLVALAKAKTGTSGKALDDAVIMEMGHRQDTGQLGYNYVTDLQQAVDMAAAKAGIDSEHPNFGKLVQEVDAKLYNDYVAGAKDEADFIIAHGTDLNATPKKQYIHNYEDIKYFDAPVEGLHGSIKLEPVPPGTTPTVSPWQRLHKDGKTIQTLTFRQTSWDAINNLKIQDNPTFTMSWELGAVPPPAKPATRPSPTYIDNTPVDIWYAKDANPDLSNLASRPFTWNEKKYLSVEHAYQTLKSGEFDPTTYTAFKKAGVKIHGSKAADKKTNIALMRELVKASFEQNPEALAKLKATGNSTLTHSKDKGIWKKEFPEILMDIRGQGRQLKSGSMFDYEIIKSPLEATAEVYRTWYAVVAAKHAPKGKFFHNAEADLFKYDSFYMKDGKLVPQRRMKETELAEAGKFIGWRDDMLQTINSFNDMDVSPPSWRAGHAFSEDGQAGQAAMRKLSDRYYVRQVAGAPESELAAIRAELAETSRQLKSVNRAAKLGISDDGQMKNYSMTPDEILQYVARRRDDDITMPGYWKALDDKANLVSIMSKGGPRKGQSQAAFDNELETLSNELRAANYRPMNSAWKGYHKQVGEFIRNHHVAHDAAMKSRITLKFANKIADDLGTVETPISNKMFYDVVDRLVVFRNQLANEVRNHANTPTEAHAKRMYLYAEDLLGNTNNIEVLNYANRGLARRNIRAARGIISETTNMPYDAEKDMLAITKLASKHNISYDDAEKLHVDQIIASQSDEAQVKLNDYVAANQLDEEAAEVAETTSFHAEREAEHMKAAMKQAAEDAGEDVDKTTHAKLQSDEIENPGQDDPLDLITDSAAAKLEDAFDSMVSAPKYSSSMATGQQPHFNLFKINSLDDLLDVVSVPLRQTEQFPNSMLRHLPQVDLEAQLGITAVKGISQDYTNQIGSVVLDMQVQTTKLANAIIDNPNDVIMGGLAFEKAFLLESMAIRMLTHKAPTPSQITKLSRLDLSSFLETDTGGINQASKALVEFFGATHDEAIDALSSSFKQTRELADNYASLASSQERGRFLSQMTELDDTLKLSDLRADLNSRRTNLVRKLKTMCK